MGDCGKKELAWKHMTGDHQLRGCKALELAANLAMIMALLFLCAGIGSLLADGHHTTLTLVFGLATILCLPIISSCWFVLHLHHAHQQVSPPRKSGS